MGTPAGFTLGELAATLGAKLEGDPGRRVTGVAPLEAAGPEQISFLIDARYRPAAETSKAGALLVAESMAPHCATRCASSIRAVGSSGWAARAWRRRAWTCWST